MAATTTTTSTEFRLKKVEGEEDWCSNPRLRDTFRQYHQEWKQGHESQPIRYTHTRFSNTNHCWSSPTRRLYAYLNKDYMDFEEHNGAHIEIWRFVIRPH